MDDIIEKLSLLDYENAFCKGWKHKRISRVYFAHPPLNDDEENQRIHCLYDMIYWLMSLNKEMTKKTGVYLNFKDFKGKNIDAVTKMLNDLKKFGLPNIKNIKVDAIKTGYGETVCQLVDELVNQELYRRDFEFIPPKFPDVEDENNSAEEFDDTDQND